MPKLNTREYRDMPILTRSESDNKPFDTDYYVEGYAARFEPYVLFEYSDGTKVYEKFDRACFDEADMSDIIMQYDHQGKVLARLRNETLKVTVDDNGLFMQADLSKSEAARNMYEEIQNGLVDRMSWAFRPGEWDFDETTSTIIHKTIKKVYDVSAVSLPANEDTIIQARSEFYGEIEHALEESKNRAERKRKLLLLLEMEEINND